MTLSLMPKDLPLPVDVVHGQFDGANPDPVNHTPGTGIVAYDPWIWANLPKMADRSQPEKDEYGGATYPSGATIVAEWGGMPLPVRDYQDMAGSVLFVRRPVKNFYGPTGEFRGPQQTAWEASYQEPTTDYWSVILGG